MGAGQIVRSKTKAGSGAKLGNLIPNRRHPSAFLAETKNRQARDSVGPKMR